MEDPTNADEGLGLAESAADQLDTNGEEMEEAPGTMMEVDEAEALKKKLAMETLGFIEREFATFRDKLYDERLLQLSHELTLLESSNPIHPEYLAMLQCIDARRDEKIEHEKIALQYQLKSLEKVSVAERSQILSQYFQTVRYLREEAFEAIGEQWFQIQQDRRKSEGAVVDFSYNFQTLRSQQISQQAAYNSEVSIISGVAKYVGFPAAPPIDGAGNSEIEEDLQRMGIRTRARNTSNTHQPHVRNVLGTSSISRPKPAAEEQFLEQTPWANPQHPVHQQRMQQAHRRTEARISGAKDMPVAKRKESSSTITKNSGSIQDGTVQADASGTTSSFTITDQMHEAGESLHLANSRKSVDPVRQSDSLHTSTSEKHKQQFSGYPNSTSVSVSTPAQDMENNRHNVDVHIPQKNLTSLNGNIIDSSKSEITSGAPDILSGQGKSNILI